MILRFPDRTGASLPGAPTPRHFRTMPEGGPMISRLVPLSVLCLALSACAVGPAYEKPAAPEVSGYTAERLPEHLPADRTTEPPPIRTQASTADNSQKAPIAAARPKDAAAPGASVDRQEIQPGEAIGARWWDNFQSPDLSRLVDTALAHNADIAVAQATLEQSEHLLQASRGTLLPQADIQAASSRLRDSGASSNGLMGEQLFSLHTGQVSVTYAPDVFGLARQRTKEAGAQADVARERLAAAQLTIAGQVVDTVLQIARTQEAVRTLTANRQAADRLLALARARYQLGATAQADLLAEERHTLAVQSQLTAQEKRLAQARQRLAILLGEFPNQANSLRVPTLQDLTLPPRLPVSLPSTLVAARPDIRAAEAQLRAANAQVGEATARLYPSFQITAAFGRQSNTVDTFLDPASRIWSLAGGLLMPLFQGGTLRAEKQAAQAGYGAALARYRSTVLKGFLEVADVLQALQHDADDAQWQAQALQAASQSLALDTAQYQNGAIDESALLRSQMQYRNAQLAAASAQVQRHADTAALYLALGGSQPPDAPSAPSGSGARPESQMH